VHQELDLLYAEKLSIEKGLGADEDGSRSPRFFEQRSHIQNYILRTVVERNRNPRLLWIRRGIRKFSHLAKPKCLCELFELPPKPIRLLMRTKRKPVGALGSEKVVVDRDNSI